MVSIGQHATLNMTEGSTTLRNVGKYLPVDLAKQPRRLKSSATPLRETEFSHKLPVLSKKKNRDITSRAVDTLFVFPWKKYFRTPQQRRTGQKSLHSIGKTISCWVTWASSLRVNLCNRQIVIVLRTRETYVIQSVSQSRSGPPGPSNLYRLPLSPF